MKFRTDDVLVGFANEFRRSGFVLLQIVEVFEEEYPGGLFHVVEFAAATRVFVEDVVDVFEGLFEHGGMLGLVLVFWVLCYLIRWPGAKGYGNKVDAEKYDKI